VAPKHTPAEGLDTVVHATLEALLGLPSLLPWLEASSRACGCSISHSGARKHECPIHSLLAFAEGGGTGSGSSVASMDVDGGSSASSSSSSSSGSANASSLPLLAPLIAGLPLLASQPFDPGSYLDALLSLASTITSAGSVLFFPKYSGPRPQSVPSPFEFVGPALKGSESPPSVSRVLRLALPSLPPSGGPAGFPPPATTLADLLRRHLTAPCGLGSATACHAPEFSHCPEVLALKLERGEPGPVFRTGGVSFPHQLEVKGSQRVNASSSSRLSSVGGGGGSSSRVGGGGGGGGSAPVTYSLKAAVVWDPNLRVYKAFTACGDTASALATAPAQAWYNCSSCAPCSFESIPQDCAVLLFYHRGGPAQFPLAVSRSLVAPHRIQALQTLFSPLGAAPGKQRRGGRPFPVTPATALCAPGLAADLHQQLHQTVLGYCQEMAHLSSGGGKLPRPASLPGGRGVKTPFPQLEKALNSAATALKLTAAAAGEAAPSALPLSQLRSLWEQVLLGFLRDCRASETLVAFSQLHSPLFHDTFISQLFATGTTGEEVKKEEVQFLVTQCSATGDMGDCSSSSLEGAEFAKLFVSSLTTAVSQAFNGTRVLMSLPFSILSSPAPSSHAGKSTQGGGGSSSSSSSSAAAGSSMAVEAAGEGRRAGGGGGVSHCQCQAAVCWRGQWTPASPRPTQSSSFPPSFPLCLGHFWGLRASAALLMRPCVVKATSPPAGILCHLTVFLRQGKWPFSTLRRDGGQFRGTARPLALNGSKCNLQRAFSSSVTSRAFCTPRPYPGARSYLLALWLRWSLGWLCRAW